MTVRGGGIRAITEREDKAKSLVCVVLCALQTLHVYRLHGHEQNAFHSAVKY